MFLVCAPHVLEKFLPLNSWQGGVMPVLLYGIQRGDKTKRTRHRLRRQGQDISKNECGHHSQPQHSEQSV